MDLDIAKAIIGEAVTGGFEDPDQIPDDDEGKIALAENFAIEAKKAWDAGIRYEEVETILRLVNPDFSGNPHQPGQEKLSVPADEEIPENYSPVMDGLESTYPRRSSGGLSESDEREGEAALEELPKPKRGRPKKNVEEALETADKIRKGESVVLTQTKVSAAEEVARVDHLPIPKEWQDEATELPRDFTELSDREVRKLQSEYNAYYTRAIWLAAVENSDLANAKHLYENAIRSATITIKTKDDLSQKTKLKQVFDAEVESDSEVSKYREAIRVHNDRLIILNALKQIYESNIDRLSREATMRKDEWERGK